MFREVLTYGKALYGRLADGSGPHDANAVPHDAAITVGAEATNVITCSIQLHDGLGAELAVRGSVVCWFSTDANGDTLRGTDAASTIAAGTDGALHEIIADQLYLLHSEADGDIDVAITKTDTGTIYMHLQMPNGRRVASGAITFA